MTPFTFFATAPAHLSDAEIVASITRTARQVYRPAAPVTVTLGEVRDGLRWAVVATDLDSIPAMRRPRFDSH